VKRLKLYPFKFKPIYKELIWGGQKLREYFGKDIPAGKRIGESWELADLPSDKSIIANGEFAGRALNSVIKEYPAEITGDKNFSGPFPLLIKFIDAEDFLSVQVHPDAWACQQTGTGVPKTEFWYIISAAEGAVIYKGLKEGVTKEAFSQAIRAGTVAEVLKKITVKQGECYFLPGGTIHSIGAGVLIAEIQTPSDTTYRIFDWNRVDSTGKPRQLHIKEAMASINFDSTRANSAATTRGCLVNCKYFKVSKEQHVKDSFVSLQAGRMEVLVITRGSGIIETSEVISVEFKAGDTLLIPATYEGKMNFRTESEYLKVTI
jgi:mannose-6-phosphate isomerase